MQICHLSLWYNKHMLQISVVFLWSYKGLTEVASRAQQMFFAAFVFDVTTDSSKHEK